MTVMFTGKAFSGVINDNANTYYTDPELNGAIGSGEKYLVELKASNVNGSPTVTVSLESSNDGINWTVRNAGLTGLTTFSIAGGAFGYGYELGTTTIGGRYARLGIKINTASTSGYIELWVTARTAL